MKTKETWFFFFLKLVSAVSLSGGFGTLGSAVMVRSGPDELRKELAEVKALCKGKPFGVDILVPGSGEGGVMVSFIFLLSRIN